MVVKLATLVTMLVAALCAASVAAATYPRDPRVGCGNTSVQACVDTHAAAAYRAYIQRTQNPQGKVIVSGTPLSLLRFHFIARDSYGHAWQGALTFKHVKAGWRVYATAQPVTG